MTLRNKDQIYPFINYIFGLSYHLYESCAWLAVVDEGILQKSGYQSLNKTQHEDTQRHRAEKSMA